MDENTSGVLTGFREAYRRETLHGLELERSGGGGWAQTLHNGFEIWWLAGMPLMLVFLLTLVSVSVVSGLEHKLKWQVEVRVPAFVWKLAARLCGGSSNGLSTKSTTKALMHTSNGLDNLTVRSTA